MNHAIDTYENAFSFLTTAVFGQVVIKNQWKGGERVDNDFKTGNPNDNHEKETAKGKKDNEYEKQKTYQGAGKWKWMKRCTFFGFAETG